MLATINSQFAAAAAAIVWMLVDALDGKKPGLVSFCVGAVAGLATVTPAAGYIQVSNAVFLGALAGLVCQLCVKLSKKWNKYGFEDALDVWGVHGMGGFFGSVMIGLLADGHQCADASTAGIDCVNPGVVTRSAEQFMKQLGASVFCAVYSFGLSYGILKGLSAFMPIVPELWEQLALDEHEHGEIAYNMAVEPGSPTRSGSPTRGMSSGSLLRGNNSRDQSRPDSIDGGSLHSQTGAVLLPQRGPGVPILSANPLAQRDKLKREKFHSGNSGQVAQPEAFERED